MTATGSRISVPARVDEIDATWLKRALTPTWPGVIPTSLRFERIGEGYGLASTIHRVTFIDARDGESCSIVVKLWPTDAPAGTAEVDFYTRLGRDPGISVPRCHHAAADTDRARGVLVLEDLFPCRQGDNNETLVEPDRGRVIDELARFQARWWGMRAPTLAALTSGRRRTADPGWAGTRRPEFEDRFGSRVDAGVRHLVAGSDRFLPAADAVLADAPPTLLHEDMHLDNVVFREPEGAPVFLDWTRTKVGAGALTMVELAFQMSPPGVHDEVIDRYLMTLNDAGAGYDRDEAERHVGAALVRKSLVWTLGVARWHPASRREERMIELSLARATHAIDVWSRRHPGWPDNLSPPTS